MASAILAQYSMIILKEILMKKILLLRNIFLIFKMNFWGRFIGFLFDINNLKDMIFYNSAAINYS